MVVAKAAQIPGGAYQPLYRKTSLEDPSPIVPPFPPLQAPTCLIRGLFPEGSPLLPPILTRSQFESEAQGPHGGSVQSDQPPIKALPGSHQQYTVVCKGL